MATTQREMRYWVFHEGQLAKALAESEAALIAAGVAEPVAKEETRRIASFLAGAVSLMGGKRA